MNYKNLPDSIKLRITKFPTPFFLFDLDHMMPKLYLKYGFIPFDRQVLGVDPYVELDLSLCNLKGLRIELR